MKPSTLTHARLLQALRYEPTTGKFFWRIRAAHRRFPGEPAGSPSKDGRIRIRIDGTLYYGYRLAWFYMTGAWPANNVDHINGDQTDDRWENLRDVTQAINLQNQRRAPKHSRTGRLGVHATPDGRFTSEIKAGKTRLRLGTHDTPDAAEAAYLKAKRTLHPGSTI